MELFEAREVVVFQCLFCNLAIELPANQDGTVNYQSISATTILKEGITDVLKVELQKKSDNITLNNDMSLNIAFDSDREIKIISKHLKRNKIRFKIIDESFSMKIPNSELEKLIDQDIFSHEIHQKIKIYFRSSKFLKKYLIRIEEYFKYSIFNEQGRLIFSFPNKNIKQILQRIFLVSKIYFVNQENNVLYLPWNSVLFLISFNILPRKLEEQIIDFMINKWQVSKSFLRNSQFELDLLKKEGKTKLITEKIDFIKSSDKKVKKKLKKHKIAEFL